MREGDNIRLTIQPDKIVQGLIPAFVPAAARESMEPLWHATHISFDANCYAYGSRHLLNGRRNPGGIIQDDDGLTLSMPALMRGIAEDGLIRIEKDDIRRGDEIAILMLRGNEQRVADYHWLSQDRSGRITNKFPGSVPTDKDFTGNVITSAETASFGMHRYEVSDYFILSETGSQIDAPLANVNTLLQTGLVPEMDIEMQDGEIIPVCRRDLEDLQGRFLKNAQFHAGFVDMTQHSLSGGQLYSNDWENGGNVRLLPGAAAQMENVISGHIKKNYARQFAL